LNPDEDLTAIWRMSKGQRFQNYRAKFTILDTGTIDGSWVRDVFISENLDWSDPRVPSALLDWVTYGRIKPLISERTKEPRSIGQQTPSTPIEKAIVSEILDFCKEDKFLFEPIAAAIWQLSCQQPIEFELTRRYRDGGRDAIGYMSIGPHDDPIRVSFSLEAKCYKIGSRVGVKETSRLISRLRHREFGVLVTTSAVDTQAYKEIRADGHPIVILSGRDIARVLIKDGINSAATCRNWIESWAMTFHDADEINQPE
jgi:hypothetical protein